jgi:hypothetical protein
MNLISSLIGLPKDLLRIDGKSPEEAAIENLSFAVSMLYNEISLFVKRKPAQVFSLVPSASGA